MPETDPNTVGATPWYKSPVMIAQVTSFVSAAVALFPKWGEAIGIRDAAQANTAVTAIFGFIAVVAPFVGSVLRAKSTIQPLTLTQAKADAHDATVVAAKRASAGTSPEITP